MKLSKLVDYANVSIGQGAPQRTEDFSSIGHPFIRAGSLELLTSGGSYESLELISDDSAKRNKLKLYPANSVVFAKSGMSATKNRVFKLELPCYVVNHLAILLPNEKTAPEYLRLVVQHARPSTLIKDPSYPSIGQNEIENFRLPFPPLGDQIRIATVLTRAEKLIAKRKNCIKALDELLKSTFLEMFGDPQVNPRRFPLVKLQELYIDPKNGTKCGPFGSALKKEELVEDGVPVWNMDNISISGQMVMPFRMWITPEKHRELKAYSVITGDVIISRAGTVGKMCVARMADQKSIISTNLIRVRFGNMLLPLYFVSLMNYCKGRVGRLKTGADGTFTHMNTGILDSLMFPCPPIESQNKFAEIAALVERIRLKYEASLKELENLYSSLAQRAFKGELDLSGMAIDHILPLSTGGKRSLENVRVVPTVENRKVANKQAPVKLSSNDERFKYVAEQIKKEFSTFDFQFKDIIESQIFDNYRHCNTSEDLKKKTSGHEYDLKCYLFDCLEGKSSLLRLEQFYYYVGDDLQLEKINLKAGNEVVKKRIKNEKSDILSGIYFRIIQ